jgi:hypothetical protein
MKKVAGFCLGRIEEYLPLTSELNPSGCLNGEAAAVLGIFLRLGHRSTRYEQFLDVA